MMRKNQSGIIGIILVLVAVLVFVLVVVVRVWNANSNEENQIDLQQEITEQAENLVN